MPGLLVVFGKNLMFLFIKVLLCSVVGFLTLSLTLFRSLDQPDSHFLASLYYLGKVNSGTIVCADLYWLVGRYSIS
jgi:hypothetical protein